MASVVGRGVLLGVFVRVAVCVCVTLAASGRITANKAQTKKIRRLAAAEAIYAKQLMNHGRYVVVTFVLCSLCSTVYSSVRHSCGTFLGVSHLAVSSSVLGPVYTVSQ